MHDRCMQGDYRLLRFDGIANRMGCRAYNCFKYDSVSRYAIFGLFVVVWFLLIHHVSVAIADNRTMNGSSNNLSNPLQGAAGQVFTRFGYFPNYGDVVGDHLESLPNPRDVSNAIGSQSASFPNSRHLSDWVVQWGQFLVHDITLSSRMGNGNVLSDGTVGDFRIPVLDANDPLGPNPIPFDRSDYHPTTGTKGPPNLAREQLNEVTTYIDASMIYGSDETRADALRTFVDGKLATSAVGQLLPLNTSGQFNIDPFGLGPSLFLAGDIRANEQVGLTATQTLFVREHNRLANLLKQNNNGLDDEHIYQLARKIVGAEIQAITYTEFLPAIMGNTAPSSSDYIYSDFVDATITNSFAAAFFRFGHSMQSPELELVANNGQKIGSMAVRDAFSNVAFLKTDPMVLDLVMKGLASQVSQEVDTMVVDELRHFLFGPPGAGGLDLLSLDIQRGRDHGLPGYNSLRGTYGLAPVFMSDISSDIDLVQTLTALYENSNSVDAWVGGMAEDHLSGASVGPLVHSVLVSQFERLRDGDRFFYTGDPDLQQSTITEVIDLDQVTLAKIIRWNTDITSIQDNVFFATSTSRCDLNSDSSCDIEDINEMYAQGDLVVGVEVERGNRFDLNGDTTIDNDDLSQWLSEAAAINVHTTSYQRGDTDDIYPGSFPDVDISDFNRFVANFDEQGLNGSSNTWDRGNFDGDSDIDITDFSLFSANFGSHGNQVLVPEVSSTILMLIGFSIVGVGLTRRRLA